MAIRTSTFNRNITKGSGNVTVTWTGLTFTSLDQGMEIQLSEYSDKTFQVFGTFGAAGAVLIEGSNDGVNWTSLSNRQGVAMSFTAAGMNTSQDKPMWVRPRITGGDGTTSLTVVASCHRTTLSAVG